MTAGIQRLGENVWCFPCHPDASRVEPNVGIICTARQTILVDAGNSPKHAQQIQAALCDIKAPPVAWIIYTHHHWDHVFGACAFGVPTIGHTICREILVSEAAKPWGPELLQDQVLQNPRLEARCSAIGRAIDDWTQFRVIPPSITFSHELELHFENVTLDLRHVGGRHAPDSIVVRVREARVMFLGDCFYVPPLHERAPGDQRDWGMLDSLVDKDTRFYVDAHSPPWTYDSWQALVAQRT